MFESICITASKTVFTAMITTALKTKPSDVVKHFYKYLKTSLFLPRGNFSSTLNFLLNRLLDSTDDF